MNPIICLFAIFLTRLSIESNVEFPPSESIVEWFLKCYLEHSTKYPRLCEIVKEVLDESNADLSDWNNLTDDQLEYMEIDYQGLVEYKKTE